MKALILWAPVFGLMLSASPALAGPVPAGTTIDLNGTTLDPESGVRVIRVVEHLDLTQVEFSSPTSLVLEDGRSTPILVEFGRADDAHARESAAALKEKLEKGAVLTVGKYKADYAGGAPSYSVDGDDLVISSIPAQPSPAKQDDAASGAGALSHLGRLFLRGNAASLLCPYTGVVAGVQSVGAAIDVSAAASVRQALKFFTGLPADELDRLTRRDVGEAYDTIKKTAGLMCFDHLAAARDAARGLKQDAEALAGSEMAIKVAGTALSGLPQP